jgi:hypothetical protein
LGVFDCGLWVCLWLTEVEYGDGIRRDYDMKMVCLFFSLFQLPTSLIFQPPLFWFCVPNYRDHWTIFMFIG